MTHWYVISPHIGIAKDGTLGWVSIWTAVWRGTVDGTQVHKWASKVTHKAVWDTTGRTRKMRCIGNEIYCTHTHFATGEIILHLSRHRSKVSLIAHAQKPVDLQHYVHVWRHDVLMPSISRWPAMSVKCRQALSCWGMHRGKRGKESCSLRWWSLQTGSETQTHVLSGVVEGGEFPAGAWFSIAKWV